MVQVPAFVARLASRLPDVSSLRFRLPASLGLFGGLLGTCLVLAASHLDARRCAEVARTRAETLAQTAGLWLDGDAHAGLGNEPERRLEDLGASLEKLLTTSGFDGQVRTLRPRAEHKESLSARPGAPRPSALEVVLQTGPNAVRQDVDYRPEMRAALFEGGVTSQVTGGRVLAYAAVPDAWGGTPALVAVEGPASAPLWRRIVFPLGAALFAGLLVWAGVLLARRGAESLVEALARLESAVESLCDRRASGPITLPRGSARELTTLAERLDGLHARLEGTAPVPAQTIAAPTGVPESTPAPATILGEPAEFDLALLMQQLVEPARGLAHSRGIEVQLVYPDGLPSQILGHPMVLFRAVDSLLRSALRTTRKGNVTLRVSRASVNGDARLRFEVADTSPGIPFKEQEELGAALAAAAAADPSTQTDPLRLASALAAALGGELGFVSQPGQGSRFGFAIALQESANPPPAAATPPLARTGFRAAQARTPLSAPNSPPNVASKGLGVSTHSHFPPSASTAFLPAPSSALPPRSGPPLGPPISSFQPRPNLPLRRSV